MLYLFGGYDCTSNIARESSLRALYDNVVDVCMTSDFSSMSKTNTLSGESSINDIFTSGNGKREMPRNDNLN
jgi:hypothetical protein